MSLVLSDAALPEALLPILQCPVCATPLTSLNCKSCKREFFSFGGVLGLLPSGVVQMRAWQHQLALLNEAAQAGYEVLHNLLERPDLMPATRARAVESLRLSQAGNASINRLLNEAGIQAQRNEAFNQIALGNLNEYYHHILQDWVWDQAVIRERLEPIQNIAVPDSPRVLALGAGAGRLSWELHKQWNAVLTLATDINPLLLLSAHGLIKNQQPLPLAELVSKGQVCNNVGQLYTAQPPQDPENKRETWHALAADVWHMPVKPGSVDVIFTGWLIDVHGGDNRQLIANIQRWLKPGGVWINSGPLLYPEHTPFEYCYSREELQQMIQLAAFQLSDEQLCEQHHLLSPLRGSQHSATVWTFRAEKSAQAKALPAGSAPPPWLIFHHLPVTKKFAPPSESHPLIDAIVQLIDGKKSVNEICSAVAEKVPEGLDVKQTVLEVLAELSSSAK